jgi:hypothetical protein
MSPTHTVRLLDLKHLLFERESKPLSQSGEADPIVIDPQDAGDAFSLLISSSATVFARAFQGPSQTLC